MLSTFESYRDVLKLRQSHRQGEIVAAAWTVLGVLFVSLVLFV